MIKRIVLPGIRLITLIGRKKSVIYCLFDDINKNQQLTSGDTTLVLRRG
ncbi:MAG: hypothetical protein Q8764_02370 [Pigeon pea little leaf phytoplasma]|nr:hypothetical protein [Pigeon pea little leaf phytoplasma]